MKTRTALFLAVAAAGLGAAATAALLGTGRSARADGEAKGVVLPSEKPITEGPLFSVGYEQEDGKVGGFTRADNPQAVPGGNGSWNEHRYGRLYRDYLIVTKPSAQKWGALLIPTSRLRSLHFAEE